MGEVQLLKRKLQVVQFGSGIILMLFAHPALALENYQIPPVTGNGPQCTSNKYKGIGIPIEQPGGTAMFDKGTCDSCKQAVEGAKTNANNALNGGKSADAGVTSATSGGTASTASGMKALQQDGFDSGSSVYSQGASGLSQQSAIAGKIGGAMNQCAQQIQSACSGVQVQEDKQAADEVAQSCQKSGQQAQQVQSEKAAKAGESGNNSAKNDSSSDKLGQMPQMPQMPSGGSGSGSGSDSGISSMASNTASTSTATEAKLGATKLDPVGGTDMGNNSRSIASIDTALGTSTTPDADISAGNGKEGHVGAAASHSASGNNPFGSSGASSSPASMGASTAASGGANGGSSGSSGGGSAAGLLAGSGGSSAGSASAGGGSSDPYAYGSGGGAGGYKKSSSPVLGLDGENGPDLKELSGAASLASNKPGSDPHSRQAAQPIDPDQQSIFARISWRIKKISAQRSMQ